MIYLHLTLLELIAHLTILSNGSQILSAIREKSVNHYTALLATDALAEVNEMPNQLQSASCLLYLRAQVSFSLCKSQSG